MVSEFTQLRFIQASSPAAPSAVEEAEARLGLRLPEDYKDFLRRNNGGEVEPVTYEAEDAAQDVVSEFLAIGAQDRDSDLVLANESLRGELPTGVLAAAHTDTGNFICVSCRTQDAGTVYFYDHEFSGGDLPEVSLTPVASTFQQFIEMLHPPPF